MGPIAILNAVAKFAQANSGRYFFPVHAALAAKCSWNEAYLALMVLREWKKVGVRKDGRWFLVVS